MLAECLMRMYGRYLVALISSDISKGIDQTCIDQRAVNNRRNIASLLLSFVSSWLSSSLSFALSARDESCFESGSVSHSIPFFHRLVIGQVAKGLGLCVAGIEQALRR